jgi:hypothetical protein
MSSRARVADPETSAELARLEAQKLAFAPMMFQAARALRDTGVLGALYRARTDGLTGDEAAVAANVSRYAANLLLEAGYASGLCALKSSNFVITKMGVVWLKDELTRVNAEFNHHVCYQGAFHLEEALRAGLPAGLRELGDWSTIYEGLSALAPAAKSAWFAFDHFYSDGVYLECSKRVFADLARPHRAQITIADIGANTGKFSRMLAAFQPNVHVTMVDLPQQLVLAQEETAARAPELAGNLHAYPANMRDASVSLPVALDVYWMSQFLDCFAEAEVVSILSRVREAMRADSRVYILETFWDTQVFEASRHCVIGTSLYFACMANGNSRMYDSAVMRRLIEQAGLRVDSMSELIGVSHTLVSCSKPG